MQIIETQRVVRRQAWLSTIVLLGILLLASSVAMGSAYPNSHLLVEPDWLAANLEREDLRIVDLRRGDVYERAHIPGAVNVQGAGALVDPDQEFSGWILGADDFQELARELGINEDTTVVVYDDTNGLSAARLFYGLELYGHFDKVRLLNGGFAAWTAARQPLSREAASVPRGNFTAELIPERVASAEYIANVLHSDQGHIILDTRTDGEYAGTDVRADRGGTIPGSVHINWVNNVESGDIQRFKSAQDLENMYQQAGVNRHDEIIPFCQTNVRGAHTYFTLRLLDYENIRPYEGSWAEWGNNEDLPI